MLGILIRIFKSYRCQSCHQNFQTSQELYEHRSNGGRSEGKIICPRCAERFPTYRELGVHIVTHRVEKLQCDYCGKLYVLMLQVMYNNSELANSYSSSSTSGLLCQFCLTSINNTNKRETYLNFIHFALLTH